MCLDMSMALRVGELFLYSVNQAALEKESPGPD